MEKDFVVTNKTIYLPNQIPIGAIHGPHQSQLFLGRETYPIYNSLDPNSWLHMLLKCKQQHIHAL